jgi:hypothetical protein
LRDLRGRKVHGGRSEYQSAGWPGGGIRTVQPTPFGAVGSTALASDGNADLAGAFGDQLSASALGNFIYDIVSALFNFHD